jgi:DNA-binding NarL/FixJ family response regulator
MHYAMIKILLVEESYIVRKGLEHLFKEFQHAITITEAESLKAIQHSSSQDVYDFILINTSLLQPGIEQALTPYRSPGCKLIYLVNTHLPAEAPDNQISLKDNGSNLYQKLEALLDVYANNDIQEELSQREQLILKHIALGLTNKEIGEKLFISTHTVISHRKNITRKLGIKTVSGLTVYAIINNIVSMNNLA